MQAGFSVANAGDVNGATAISDLLIGDPLTSSQPDSTEWPERLTWFMAAPR